MKMLRHAARFPAVFVFLGGDIVEALRPQKIPPSRPPHPAGERDGVAELGVGIVRRKVIISRPALRIEAVGHGDRLEEGGFSASIFPDEEGDGVIEADPLHVTDGGDISQITVRGDPAPVDQDAVHLQSA